VTTAPAPARLPWPGRARLAAWVSLAAAVAISLAGVSPPAFWARLFFAAVFLVGAVAAAGLVGPRTQLATGAVILALAVCQRAIDRPVTEPPSPQWTRALERPGQLVQHEIALPVGSPSWESAWRRAAGAFVYVCARSPLDEADGLELLANDVSLGPITEARAVGPRPGPTFVGFYRLSVERALLERRQPARFVLQRQSGAAPRPIPICGTFTYRPTAGLDSSRFFDGAAWWHPGPTQQGRFEVELRLEDARGTPIWVAY
jgi:hypothetical protein